MSSQSQFAGTRFWQFSLRQLLVLIAVVGILLSIVAARLHSALESRRILRAEQAALSNQQALNRAVSQGQGAECVRQALEAGANPSAVLPNAKSLLHTAVELGQCETVQVLLDYGADVEQPGRITPNVVPSGPPLFAAVACKQPTEIRMRMVRMLIAHGADIRREVTKRNLMDLAVLASDGEMGDLLREHGLPYGPREMAAFNRIEELKRAVHAKPNLLHQRFRPLYAAKPGQGPTLLGIALDKGHRELALLLIEMGAPLDTTEYLGQTLMHTAAQGGNPELIRLLAARALDVNARDDYDDTPLNDIVWRGAPEVVSALIEAGADVNAVGLSGKTPLHSAVQSGNMVIIKMLVKAGADPTILDREGRSAIDYAPEASPELRALLEQVRLPSHPASQE